MRYLLKCILGWLASATPSSLLFNCLNYSVLYWMKEYKYVPNAPYQVADVDLTPLPPLVMAQLCLVTGLHKGRGGAVKVVHSWIYHDSSI